MQICTCEKHVKQTTSVLPPSGQRAERLKIKCRKRVWHGIFLFVCLFSLGTPDLSEGEKNLFNPENWSLYTRNRLIRGWVKRENIIEIRVQLAGDKRTLLLNRGLDLSEVDLRGKHYSFPFSLIKFRKGNFWLARCSSQVVRGETGNHGKRKKKSYCCVPHLSRPRSSWLLGLVEGILLSQASLHSFSQQFFA